MDTKKVVKNPDDPDMDAIKRRSLLLKMYQEKRQYRTAVDDEIPEYLLRMSGGPTKRVNILLYLHFSSYIKGQKLKNSIALMTLKNLKRVKLPEHMQDSEQTEKTETTGKKKKRSRRKYAWEAVPGEINPIAIAESPVEALVDFMPRRLGYQRDLVNIKKMMENVSIMGDIPRNVNDLMEKTFLKENFAHFVMAYAWNDYTDGMPLTRSCLMVMERLGWIPLYSDPNSVSLNLGALRELVKSLFGFGMWKYVYYTLQGHSELVCYRKTRLNPKPNCIICVMNKDCPSSLTVKTQHTYQDTLINQGYLKGEKQRNITIKPDELLDDLEAESDPNSSM